MSGADTLSRRRCADRRAATCSALWFVARPPIGRPGSGWMIALARVPSLFAQTAGPVARRLWGIGPPVPCGLAHDPPLGRAACEDERGPDVFVYEVRGALSIWNTQPAGPAVAQLEVKP